MLNEGLTKGQPGLQRDLYCPASVEIPLLVRQGWFLAARDNPCCAQSALLGS